MRRILVLTLGAALAAAGCSDPGSGEGPTASPSTRVPAPALNAAEAPLLPTDRFALPEVTPDSFATLLEQLRGTPVLVNVWGSWCGPCRGEAPALAEAAETYGRRVQFIGIDILDDRESARGFMREYGWRYPSLYDPSPTGTVRDQMGFVGQPITVIFDASGERVFSHVGQVNADMLRTELEKVA
jgi:thiol-disulfide isomerase/thioredoxin